MTTQVTTYDSATHGWDGTEPVVYDSFPFVVNLVLAFPVIAIALLIGGNI